MNISNTDQNITITNNLPYLDISGTSNNIIIKSHVIRLKVSGIDNFIDGTDPNCIVDNIEVTGINNKLRFNNNCLKASQKQTGFDNDISFGDTTETNQNNNGNIGNNFPQFNNNFGQFNNNNVQVHNYYYYSHQSSNPQNFSSQNNYIPNNNNNFAYNNNNAQNNQQSNNNNVQNNNSVQNNNNEEQKKNDPKINIFASTKPGEEDYSNLTDHERKIRQLFLEMDEYQYKHIQKYESRKETECAICLEEFKGTDMIKAFHKCDHIFHKNCLRDWLKKQVVCPLCKHDLEDDIKTMK